jgi:anti-sigma factor RsiW
MQRSTDRAVYRLNQAKPSLGTIPSMQGLTSMEDGDLIAACERFRADHAEWDKQVRSRQSPVGGECDLGSDPLLSELRERWLTTLREIRRAEPRTLPGALARLVAARETARWSSGADGRALSFVCDAVDDFIAVMENCEERHPIMPRPRPSWLDLWSPWSWLNQGRGA